ncbi:MAG: anti-sigma factor [Pseudomonadota bacterium]
MNLYGCRWRIEEFFRTVKDVLKVEESELDDAKSTARLLFFVTLKAMFLDRLRQAATRRGMPRLAAAAALVSLGVLLGFFSRGLPTQPDQAALVASLPRQAALAHAVYSPEVRHPVEVGAAQEEHLVQWLSKRLGHDLTIPRLGPQGFDLVGGRLLPGEAGPAAQFMYQDAQGLRLTLYVRKASAGNRETAFRYAREDRVGVFYWIDGPFGYALSGEVPRERLLTVAESVYRQLNR